MKTISLSAALVALTVSLPVNAQDVDDFAQVSVLDGWRMENGHQMAAIKVALADGWHTYWRAPGEAGIPPRFIWTGAENVAEVRFHWPVPQVYHENGMWFIGYEDELILPMEIVPAGTGPIRLSGEMELGVCDDICMPMTAVFTSDFGQAMTQSQTAPIQAALQSRPKSIASARCDVAPTRDGMRVTARIEVPDLGQGEVAVIEHPDHAIWISEGTVTRKGNAVTVVSELVPPEAAPFPVDRSDLIVSVLGNGRAYEARGCLGG